MARIAPPSSVQSWSDSSRVHAVAALDEGRHDDRVLRDMGRQPAITRGNWRDDLRHALLVQQPRNHDRELIEGATPKLDEVPGVHRFRAIGGAVNIGAKRQKVSLVTRRP